MWSQTIVLSCAIAACGETANPRAGGTGEIGGAGASSTGGRAAADSGSATAGSGGIAGSAGAKPGSGGARSGSDGSTEPTTNDASPDGASENRSPSVPPAATDCPAFDNGATVEIPRENSANGSVPVVLYMADAPKSAPDPGGPLVLYYHTSGSSPDEVHTGFGDSNIAQVTAMGGVVAAFTSTACPNCTSTDADVWFVEDDAVQDTVVACAIQQARIDPRHIHALGGYAGALHSAHVALARSSYIASIISFSGGYPPIPGTDTIEDPSNHVSAIMSFCIGCESVVFDPDSASHKWFSTLAPKGYYTLLCGNSQGSIDKAIAARALEFFMAHPYEVHPEPYRAGPPADFPSYCSSISDASTAP